MSALQKETLVYAWSGLLLLTAAGLLVGRAWGHASWLPFLVAGLIWLKGLVVARYFLNIDHAHPYVAWLVRIFIAFAPASLLLTDALSR